MAGRERRSEEMTVGSDVLADAAELRCLVEVYAQAMDAGDPEGFHEIFVPEGALIVLAPGSERQLGAFEGPGGDGVGLIAGLLDELYRDTMHHITNHTVEVDGDSATGTTYCLAYHLCDDAAGQRIETLGVTYADSYVRTAAGWRIHTRRATRVWSQIEPLDTSPLLVDRAAGRRARGG
jgi:hypothetical protein